VNRHDQRSTDDQLSSVVVTTSFAFPGPTGSPLLSMQIAEGLVAEGIDVVVIRYRGVRSLRTRTEQWNGIDVHTVPLALLVPTMLKVRSRHRPSLVQAHDRLGAKLGALMSVLARVPLVVEYHGVTDASDRPARRLRRVHRLLDRLARRRIDAGIVYSQRERELAVAAWPMPPLGYEVIYPAVEDECFGPPTAPSTDDPAVGYVGNFRPWQGVDLLAEAMRTVWRSRPDARLVLHGVDEANENRWRALLAELPGPWSLDGRLPVESIPATLRSLDVLVMPRPDVPTNTTTGKKLGEYLASGRSVVVTDVGDHRRLLVDPPAALVVPPDADGVAAGILDVLADPGAALDRSKHAVELARAQFAERAAIDRRIAVFTSAIHHRSRT